MDCRMLREVSQWKKKKKTFLSDSIIIKLEIVCAVTRWSS